MYSVLPTMTSGSVLQNQVTRHITQHDFVVIGTEWRKGDELEEVGLLSTRHLQLEDESRLTIARHQTPKQTRLRCNHGNKSTTQHTHDVIQNTCANDIRCTTHIVWRGLGRFRHPVRKACLHAAFLRTGDCLWDDRSHRRDA